MGMFQFFFNTRKPNGFDYKPMYWDPEKEEREKLHKRLEAIEENGVDAAKTRISGAFARKGSGHQHVGERRKYARRSNFTLIFVILLLALIAYFALNVYLPRGGFYFE